MVLGMQSASKRFSPVCEQPRLLLLHIRFWEASNVVVACHPKLFTTVKGKSKRVGMLDNFSVRSGYRSHTAAFCFLYGTRFSNA